MEQGRYVNYHCHSYYSNIMTPDSTISNEDRAKKASDLGHKAFSVIEHGWQGRFVEGIELGEKYKMMPLIGSEAYFVKNREEKDATNAHLIVIAKNENGRKALNLALSEANLTGFYCKPRLDLDLVLGLPSNDVWLTTACIGGIWKYGLSEAEELIKILKNKFGSNFFLEVQYHNVDRQKEINKEILRLSNKYYINIIAGMDSHMIALDQEHERDNYLKSRGIHYPEEENWYMDFPSYEEAYIRFEAQGVLNKYKIQEALNNTLVFEDVDKYDSPIFNHEIKLPTLYPEKKQSEKNEILKALIYKQWENEKKNIPVASHPLYEKEIEKELDIIFETHMADYFLLDYEIIKKGKEMGGSITMTGRGSAPSFYLSRLLGFTTIDRISAPIKLFPERFMSSERLLEAKSLPDIDFNLGTPEVFAKSQEIVMGEGHSYQMLAFGTVKSLGAWKMHARVQDIDFDTANSVSDQIRQYAKAIIHAQSSDDANEEPEDIDEYEYIDESFHDLYDESKKYIGIVNTITPHPCAYLLFSDGDIREEFGLIKIKTGKVEHICACCDGLFAEEYKMLKNDLLKVSVVDLIHRVYNKVGIEPHSLPELIRLCENDEKVWEIYKNAWTMGINQVEQHGSAGRVSKYAPKNISELSAFVAAIRPGFQSYYKQFEAREPYQFGVESLDDVLQTKEFPQSYMLYQENVMQVMAYAGIPLSEAYDAIKNIAKKRKEYVLSYETIFLSKMVDKLKLEGINQVKASEIAQRTWQVVQDSCRYGFNASHAFSVAGDSLYGAYLKAHHTLDFYETFLRMLEEDGDKDRLSKARVEAEKAYGIQFPPFRFGQDNRQIVADHKNNFITASLKTIKGFGDTSGENLYDLHKMFDGKTFVDLLIVAEENGFLSSKWEKLIKINYFKKFGGNVKLLKIFNEFRDGDNRYKRSHTDNTKSKRKLALEEMWENMRDESMNFIDQVNEEREILGYILYRDKKIDKRYIYVLDLDTRYAPRFQGYCLSNGKQESLKIYSNIFENKEFEEGSILYCKKFEKKPPYKFVNGQFVHDMEAEKQWWVTVYDTISYDEFKSIYENA